MEQISKDDILLKIKNNEEISFSEWYKLTLDDLLLTDEMNISYLEYCCKNKIDIEDDIKESIKNNSQALYICLKNNHIEWMFSIKNEDVFFEEIDGKLLIEHFFESKKDCYSIISGVKNHVEIIDLMIKYSNNQFYYLSSELIDNLFIEKDGKFFYDKYVNNRQLNEKIIKRVSKDVIINYCIKTNNYSLLKYCKEEILLTKIDSEKIVLEKLLDLNIDPLFYGYDFENNETFEILINNNRFDLLYNAKIDLLLESFDEKNSYLDVMIQKQKEGKEVHLEKISLAYRVQDPKMTAVEIMTFAKHNMIGYIIDKMDLNGLEILKYKTSDSKTILEYLLEIDRDLTINEVISKIGSKKNPDFAIFLESFGINVSEIKIDNNEVNFSDEYINMVNDSYDKGCVCEYEDLLLELKKLFYNDGISEKEFIDSLIKSYRYLTSIGNQVAIIELKQLIEIKKKNPKDFTYVKSDDGSYFSQNKKSVFLDENVISTINHETSHALHFFLADNYVPENYFEVIERTRNNPQIKDNIVEYSKTYAELKEKVKESISESQISDYYDKKYSGEKLLELTEFLKKSKEEKKESLKESYPEDVLDIILEKTYSPDEFIQQRKKIEINELLFSILSYDYDAFVAISDIIDAIFVGRFFNNVLLDKEDKRIKAFAGHGIGYYSSEIHGFDEMIAEYGTILKSKNSEGMIEYLRMIVGDEVVDMIEDVYENRILNSTKIMEEERANAR